MIVAGSVACGSMPIFLCALLLQQIWVMLLEKAVAKFCGTGGESGESVTHVEHVGVVQAVLSGSIQGRCKQWRSKMAATHGDMC